MKIIVLKLLDILRKGLKVFTNGIKFRKDVLQARLAKRKSISPKDKQWLCCFYLPSFLYRGITLHQSLWQHNVPPCLLPYLEVVA
jgi:hypothetical protein